MYSKWLALMAAIAVPDLAAAGVDDLRGLQAACFSSAQLAAVDRERAPQRAPRSLVSGFKPGDLVGGPAVDPSLRGAIRRVQLPPGSRKLIALTLDFCEQAHEIAGYDGAIIDILRRERVPATLFMGGKWMLSHDERTRQLMSDPLFEIGSHGWAHRNVRGLASADLSGEILGPSAAYRQARASLSNATCAIPHAKALVSVPVHLSLTRFAFGACHAESLRVANNAGLLAIQWDVSTGDPSPQTSAREIAATMLRQTQPGSIILAHANGRGHHTAEALPAAIKGLRERGFEFVTVGDLLRAGKPVIVDTCYDSRPGDTDKYDRLFGR